MVQDFCIAELERGTSYQIRIQALNVNGSGPATDRMTKVTYVFDLDGRCRCSLHVSMPYLLYRYCCSSA